MWMKGTSTEILPAVDNTSSATYVYLYRNFTEKHREMENGESKTYYEYEYAKIKKDVYEYVRESWATEDRTTEIEDVLAELLFGGDEE
ncbi:MAG: hypothetical protein J5864_06010 [Oscillospiraceae bacterium]|nr:hypothetical protein [Oscillospiraceae bacterium]